jgi:hypothetical protein
MSDTKYVLPADRQEHWEFALGLLGRYLSRALPPELWHYTNADGLIGILESGCIFTTQIACLNDQLEERYFGNLVLAGVRDLLKANADPRTTVMLRVAEAGLLEAESSATGRFVACFSEVGDDLGQWRGYGGGQCGYAIGFHSKEIMEAIKNRQASILLPLCYDAKLHEQVVREVLQAAERFYLGGVARAAADLEGYAQEFLLAFAEDIQLITAGIKHPAFEHERERRISTLLFSGEETKLIFKQRQSLLARHLPFDLRVGSDSKKLPISGVVIGPGPSQQVSRVSVGDLLLKYGYRDINVHLSSVPYRVP